MTKLDNRQDEKIVTDAPIDETGELIRAQVPGDRHVSLNILANGDADYAVDVAAAPEGQAQTPDTWFEAEEEYLASEVDDPQDIRDGFILGDRFIRVRVTSAAAGGSTADVTLQVA